MELAQVAVRTDVGLVRERNEDAAYIDASRRFFIVADGMGGQNAGDVASAMAVGAIREGLLAATSTFDAYMVAPTQAGRLDIRDMLERAIHRANQLIFERSNQESDKRGMGTTLEVVVILGDEAFVAHIGDSRTYLFREGGSRQLTVDHTVAEVMQRAGTLSPEEAKHSHLRSMLSNAVGVLPGVAIDHFYVRLRPADRLLLCSDGLYEYFDTEELAQCALTGSADDVLKELVAQARERGGHDNITGILIDVAAGATPSHELDDAPTTPIALPVESSPLAGVDDDMLSAVVERVWRESSRQHLFDATTPTD